MQYTRNGWRHETEDGTTVMPVLTMDFSKRRTSYSLSSTTAEDIARCCLSEDSEASPIRPMTLAETILLLGNIALGQRRTTPPSQSKFIDRVNRTFFVPGLHIAPVLSQEAVTRISALANYIHIKRWDRSFGITADLFEEYLLIAGSLAVSLLAAAKRYRKDPDGELSWFVRTDKHNLNLSEIPRDEADEIASHMTAAMSSSIVEGAMISCALADHTTVSKDRENLRLRNSIRHYLETFEELSLGERVKSGELHTWSLLIALDELAGHTVEQFWIVERESDKSTPYQQYVDNRADDRRNLEKEWDKNAKSSVKDELSARKKRLQARQSGTVDNKSEGKSDKKKSAGSAGKSR